MLLQLRCVAQCDTEGCEFEEEMFIQLELADGFSLFGISDMPPPPGWEQYARMNVKKLRCPECIAQRKRGRLKVVSDEAKSGS